MLACGKFSHYSFPMLKASLGWVHAPTQQQSANYRANFFTQRITSSPPKSTNYKTCQLGLQMAAKFFTQWNTLAQPPNSSKVFHTMDTVQPPDGGKILYSMAYTSTIRTQVYGNIYYIPYSFSTYRRY